VGSHGSEKAWPGLTPAGPLYARFAALTPPCYHLSASRPVAVHHFFYFFLLPRLAGVGLPQFFAIFNLVTTPSSTPFAALLRQLRVFRGVSQQKLADLAHVSVGAVASAEAARSLPSVRTGVALFRALDALEPIDATATTAWAEALDTAEALLRRHQHQVVDAYLASAAAAPTDHATAAHAALGRLLARTNPAAVLGLLTAAEHLLAPAGNTNPSA